MSIPTEPTPSHPASAPAPTRKRKRAPVADGPPAKRARTTEEIHAMVADVGAWRVVKDVMMPLSDAARTKILNAASPDDRCALRSHVPPAVQYAVGPIHGAPAAPPLLERSTVARYGYRPLGAEPVPVVRYHSSLTAPLYKLSNSYAARIVLNEQTLRKEKMRAALDRQFPGVYAWLREDVRAGTPACFPSAEHLWQAFKAADRATFDTFKCGGPLATLPPTRGAAWPPGTAHPFAALTKSLGRDMDFSKAYKGGTPASIGLLAKLAASPARAAKLGLRMRPTRAPAANQAGLAGDLPASGHAVHWPRDERTLWLCLLAIKFDQHEALGELLLSTGASYLLEFSRNARNDALKTPPVFDYWAGNVAYALGEQEGDAPTLRLYGRNKMGRFLMRIRRALVELRAEEAVGESV